MGKIQKKEIYVCTSKIVSVHIFLYVTVLSERNMMVSEE
ncbi:hypothetical protein GFC30_3304 (plasmid) [Anoxybacillus amylolyticus]|uniref:Uncharacterized protein n=1 Tax=Anoxybacteroides amylolyticum TaxID=294699 RepID=A0A167TTZ6_9BACL|nr:hypothetical protein GFC30_3304 [Anoxybacillus amylolyticus]